LRREGQSLAILQDAGYKITGYVYNSGIWTPSSDPGDLTPIQQMFCTHAHIWILQQKSGAKPEEIYTTDELAEMRAEEKSKKNMLSGRQRAMWNARKADIIKRYNNQNKK
jgi:hypothetical protein